MIGMWSMKNITGRCSLRSKAVLMVAGFFFALMAVELGLRVFGFGYKLAHRPPQDRGADYRIFCVGESTTVGVGAKDPDLQSYPRQLERLLSEHFPDKRIQVFFDQTIGINTSENLMKLPGYLNRYDPQMVIFMVGVNNWWNMDKSNILLFSKSGALSRMTLKTLVFLDRFRLWKLLKWLQFSLGWYRHRYDYRTPESEKFRMVLKREGANWMKFFNLLAEHDLEEMVKICKTNNIQPVICTYPMGAFGGLSRIQRGIAEKFDVPFVDLYGSFRQLPNREDYVWRDHWHVNEKGYALAAQNIYECIVRRDLIGEGR